MFTRRPIRSRALARAVPRRRLAALAVLTPLVTGGVLTAAGPAGAVPFEGNPDTTRCERLVSRSELTGEPTALPADRPFGAVPLVAVLVPLSEC
ncbi:MULTISPECIES: hypothetical protein [unclassified Geodermatophilus]